jgi:hypothetical protein
MKKEIASLPRFAYSLFLASRIGRALSSRISQPYWPIVFSMLCSFQLDCAAVHITSCQNAGNDERGFRDSVVAVYSNNASTKCLVWFRAIGCVDRTLCGRGKADPLL